MTFVIGVVAMALTLWAVDISEGRRWVVGGSIAGITVGGTILFLLSLTTGSLGFVETIIQIDCVVLYTFLIVTIARELYDRRVT